jgi:hypothetical protein
MIYAYIPFFSSTKYSYTSLSPQCKDSIPKIRNKYSQIQEDQNVLKKGKDAFEELSGGLRRPHLELRRPLCTFFPEKNLGLDLAPGSAPYLDIAKP